MTNALLPLVLLIGINLLPFSRKDSPIVNRHSAFRIPQSEFIQWDTPTEHDFGKVYMGKPVRHVFSFVNTGDQPLMMQTVRTTCGCTAAEWSETPIEPGQKGEVVIEFDAYIKGAFRKKIRVFFDKQKAPEILWVLGDVE
jgi:hypothetical protein